jgi:hypothetical protein
MPSQRYALVSGGTPRVEVSWAADYSTLRVSFDGRPIGEVPDRASLEAGDVFEAPDGSQIQVRLASGFPFNAVHVELNGQPLPGSPGDPQRQVKRAAVTVYAVAALTLAAGFVGPTPAGAPVLVAGAVLAALAELTRRGSSRALALAIGFYGIDTLWAMGQGLWLATILHLVLLAAMARALPTLLARRDDVAAGATGRGLDEPGPVPTPEIVPPPRTPAVSIGSGALAGARFHLAPGRPLGFGARGDVPVAGLESLRPRLLWSAQGLHLQVLGAGATVNGLAHAGAALRDGDRVGLGHGCELLVHLPDDLPAAGGPAIPAPVRPAPAPAPVAAPAPQPARPAPGPPPAAVRRAPSPRPVQRASSTSRPAARQKPGRSWRPIAVMAAVVAVVAASAFVYIRFLRPPVVDELRPGGGFAQDEVSLIGRFAAAPGDHVVRFGTAVATVVGGDGSSLRVRVPEIGRKSRGQVVVTVETPRGSSASLPFDYKVRPRWSSIDPPVAQPGTTLALVGEGFDAGPQRVTIAGRTVTPKAVSPGRLTIALPADLTSPPRIPVKVSVAVAGEELGQKDLLLGHLPFVTDFQPRVARGGERVRLQGFGFEAGEATRVLVGGRPGLIVKATPTSLEFDVPALRSGAWLVEVETRGVRSTADLALSVDTTTGGRGYVLRFLAAPALDRDEVLDVATEFAPVLRLARPAGPAGAERATAVVAALNAQVSLALAGRVPAFEVRESPEGPVVAIVEGDPIVTVLPGDAAAYGDDVAPEALARHWSSLLADYFTLFLELDRPSRLVRSPRGKAMLDLHAALRIRRGQDVIDPGAPDRVAPEISARLEDLALRWEASGADASPESVVGSWRGRLQEASGPAREMTLELQLRGRRLEGTLRFEESGGGLAQRVTELRIEKEELAFVARVGGTPHRFRVRIAKSRLLGTAQATNDPKATPHGVDLALQE